MIIAARSSPSASTGSPAMQEQRVQVGVVLGGERVERLVEPGARAVDDDDRHDGRRERGVGLHGGARLPAARRRVPVTQSVTCRSPGVPRRATSRLIRAGRCQTPRPCRGASSSARPDWSRSVVGVLAALVYAAGYGADNDTWLMLGTWDVLVDEQRYVPSRPPGYLLPEVVIGATADIGGHWLSNLVSVLLAAATLAALRLVRRRTGETTSAALLVAVLGLTPAFVLAATTSMDYAMACSVRRRVGGARGRRARPWCGGLLLGLAAVSRLAYAPLGLVVVLLGPGRTRPAGERGRRRRRARRRHRRSATCRRCGSPATCRS